MYKFDTLFLMNYEIDMRKRKFEYVKANLPHRFVTNYDIETDILQATIENAEAEKDLIEHFRKI